MKLWLDVDDLFFFARHSGRPTGIQRLAGETYKAFAATCPERVGFVIHNRAAGGFTVIDWTSVAGVYERLTQGTISKTTAETSEPRLTPLDRVLWVLGLYRTPEGSAQLSEPDMPDGPSLERVARAGDVLCSLGAPWHNPDYASQVARVCTQRGLTFAMLVYDLIPLVRPEYFHAGLVPNFEPFMRQTLPLASLIFTISRHTASDVIAWADAQGIPLRSQPVPVPIGTGFARPDGGRLPPGLRPDEFVLFVSTIEVRKNHLQPFRIWARLLRELPPERVPKLVFVGKMGWMVDDLFRAIVSTNSLNGHLVVLNDVDDGALAELYRGCKFTLFTSHYEGWGLPVSDSLAFGKLCVASNTTSIPEAGKSLCAYVDPDDTTHAYDLIRNLIVDADHLAELERQVSSKFRHTPWTDTAQAILTGIDQHLTGVDQQEDGLVEPRSILSGARALRR